MKNFKALIFLLALVAGFGLAGYELYNFPGHVKANPSRFEQTFLTGSTATTTMVSATSTLTFLTDGADRADVNLIFRASSSVASLSWVYEYSSDGVNWYGEDYIAAQNNVNFVHSSTTPVHLWTPSAWTAIGTTSSSSMRSILNIPVSNNTYVRIRFNPVGANGLLWADAIVKVQDSN